MFLFTTIHLNNNANRNVAHLKPVIRPASELHLAVLVVEGEPGDVDLAGGHEDAGRDVGALPLRCHHHICWIGPIKCFAGTEEGELKIVGRNENYIRSSVGTL